MVWTVATFQYQARYWHERAVKCSGRVEARGHHSYALQQHDMWIRWADEADIRFKEVLSK